MLSALETIPRESAATSPPTDMAKSSTHPTLSAPPINDEDQAEHSGDTSLETDPAHKPHELPPFLRGNSSPAPSISISFIVNSEEKSARSKTAIDASSVNSAPHISFKEEASTPTSRTGNIPKAVDLTGFIVPVDIGSREAVEQYTSTDSAKGMMKEDDATTYATARSRLSFRSFFTRSSGKQSQNGATWRQAFNLTMNSGFGPGAPRGGKYVGVREGRERGGYLPRETGVGRTGKRPAPVPAGLIAAIGLKSKNSYLADAKKQVKELIDEVAEMD